MTDRFELPHGRLRWRCDPGEFPFQTTQEVEPISDIIGQERAIRAIQLGLDVKGKGYNIFVAGFVGTGRNTTIKRFLEEVRSGKTPASDLAYVNNFSDPDRPRLLRFPAGQGCEFRAEMKVFVDRLRKAIPRILESDYHARLRQETIDGFQEREKEIRRFDERLSEEGMAILQVGVGPSARPEIVPVVEGKPADLGQLAALAEAGRFEKAEYERLRKKVEELGREVRDALRKARQLARDRDERLEELEKRVVKPAVHEALQELAEQFPHTNVPVYLEEVERDILSRLGELKGRLEPADREAGGAAADDPFRLYEVNLIVDNGKATGSPVIVENFPTFRNLFGTIESEMEGVTPSGMGFLRIKAGSLIGANGGHLVLNAADVLGEPGVWTMLKRILRTGVAEIQSYEAPIQLGASLIKPEPIEVDVKVVLIGDHDMYTLLYDLDREFRKVFKIKADFDTEMPNDAASRLAYARFIQRIVQEEGLLPFDRTGVAAIIEEGARAADRSDRLTTRFNFVADLVCESSYWALQQGSPAVTVEHVDKAVAERHRRVSLYEDKIQEMLDKGQLLVDTVGERVGQVNGLYVHQIGDHTFGRPARITASIGMGRLGIVNIERESELSGPIHDKGVLILSGYLREKFAREKPLTLSASVCFEQSYSGIDGDSASSAEVCALLSELSGLPFRQDIAMTGSINQKGDIQPIGGVNHKIEGFYDTCVSRGLSGRQGVLIPRSNLDDLMVRKDIAEASAAGTFHVYAMDTIGEALEILSGRPAGTFKEGEGYAEESVLGRANARLLRLAEEIRPFGPADAG